jgi:tetratricopeptide (TPR) repeat protein
MNRSPQTQASKRPAGPVSWPKKLLLVGFGFAVVLLCVGATEGLLALVNLGDPQLYEDPYVGFAPGRQLFTETDLPDGRRVFVTSPGKLSFFDYQEFPAEKGPDTYRIFALGGSTTAGRPYDWKVAFPHWMQLYLEAMDPSRPYEVVNAGAISYASYRIVTLMRELIAYEPDLFVIYTGHNEFLEERTYGDIIHQNPTLKTVRSWLGGLRAYNLARQGFKQLQPAEGSTKTILPGEVEAKLDGWTGLELYERDNELQRSIVEHFDYNLRQMIAIAEDHGAEVIFVSPVSNLKDFSPFKSQHSESLSRQQKDQIAVLLVEERALLDSGQEHAALELLERALELDPEYAETHFRMGRCLLRIGDSDSAHAAFVRAKDLDVAPLRALGAIEERVEAVAREHGLSLVDLPGILEVESLERHGTSILGNEYLLDHVHPDFPTHSLIAERVIDVLVERGIVRPAADWTPAKEQAIYDDVVSSIDVEYYGHRDHNLGKVLVWAGKVEEAEAPLLRAASVLTDNPEVRLNLGILYEKTGRWQEAVTELRRALELDPSSAEAHFNLGTNLGYLGRPDEGILSLLEAIRLLPDYPLAYFNLGLLYQQQGQTEQALAAFERAGEQRPDAAEVPRNLGLVYRRQGQPDRAIEAFNRALELDPGDLVARTELGIVYGEQGQAERATEELERAIDLAPDHAEAHYNLAVVYNQRGMRDQAIAAYERSIAADPASAKPHNNLGILYAGMNRLDEARENLERAIQTDPQYAEAHFNLGIVYDSTGRPRDAILAIQRALELRPEDAKMHFAIASLYQALGDGERARPHFERAKEGGLEP